MNETLISIETARLAKSKNFTWNCEFYYDAEDKLVIPQYYEDTPNNGTEGLFFFGSKFQCAVPSQSTLQRWLRQVHDIHILIVCGESGLPYYDVCVMKDNINHKWSNDDYSYEDALEKGLQIGLNIIK